MSEQTGWRVGMDGSDDVDIMYRGKRGGLSQLVGFYRVGPDWLPCTYGHFTANTAAGFRLVHQLLSVLDAELGDSEDDVEQYCYTSVPPVQSAGQARVIAEMAVARLNELEEKTP
ncbi:MAG: hypothetical protein ACOCXX_04345 [Planctomycetota bacterium]